MREPEFIDMDVAFRINLYRCQIESDEPDCDLNELNHDTNELDSDLNELNHDINELDSDLNELNHDINELNKSYNDSKTDLEVRVSEIIRKNPNLTQKALGEALSVSVSTVKRVMTKMQHEGKVIHEGSHRNGKWILKEWR